MLWEMVAMCYQSAGQQWDSFFCICQSRLQLAHQWKRKILKHSYHWPSQLWKEILLRPLKDIFQTFSNPTSDKYPWVGAEKANMIFLNAFRWLSGLINGTIFSLYQKATRYTFMLRKIVLVQICPLKRTPPYLPQAKDILNILVSITVPMNKKMR